MKWDALLVSAALTVSALHVAEKAHCGPSAEARPSVVLLVEDASERFVGRLQDELSAFGFDSVVVRLPSEIRSPEEVQAVADQRDAAAALRVRTSRAGVEVWIADRMTGKTMIREVVTDDEYGDPEQTQRLVAIQTVELLRASLLEIQLPHRPPAAIEVPAETAARVMRSNSPFALAFGVGTVWTFGDLGPSVQAETLGSYQLLPSLKIGLVSSLPLTSATVQADEGTAQVHVARVGLLVRVLLGQETSVFVPRVGFGGDVLFTRVGAQAAVGFASRPSNNWSLLGRVELGASLRVTRRVGLSFDAWLGSTPQSVVVSFDDAPEATVGPLLTGTLVKVAVAL